MGLQPQKCIRGGKRGLAVNTSYVTPRPLDLLPNAALAKALRALSVATLTSPIIKVRRTSDNAQADVYADLSTPWAEVTLNSPIVVTSGSSSAVTLGGFCAGTNGAVVTWYDQSGLARHATQATTGAQPLLVQGGELVKENGRPALFFDGVDDFFNIPAGISLGNGFSFFYFSGAAVSGAGSPLLGTTLNNFSLRLPEPTIGRLRVSLNTSYIDADFDANQPTARGVCSVIIDSDTVYGAINGIHPPPVSGSPITATPMTVIGRRGTTYALGRISEIVAYNSNKLTTRAAITAAQARYFGIILP